MALPRIGFHAAGYVVGASRAKAGRPATFEGAVEDAYERAKKKLPTPLEFRVTDVFVTGSNPISEYRVVLQLP